MRNFVRPVINTAIIISLVSALTLAIGVAASSSAGAATYNTRCSTRVLQEGDNGECVRQAQRKLADHGVYSGSITGNFASRTEAAVIELQTKAGIDDDGIIGPDTWRVLNTEPVQANNTATITDVNDFSSRSQRIKQQVEAVLPAKCRTEAKTICVLKGKDSQALLVAVSGGQIQRYMIARTGDARGPESVTTVGDYKVTWKDIDHISSQYNKAPMDYSLFFNEGQAIHYSQDFADYGFEGPNGSSHGCVNLKSRSDARWLYGWSVEGSTNVYVIQL